MTEGVDRDAGSEVEVDTALLVPDAHAFTADESKRKASVGGNDVPGIKFGGGWLQALGHGPRW